LLAGFDLIFICWKLKMALQAVEYHATQLRQAKREAAIAAQAASKSK